jgi:cytochrome P450
MSPLYLGQVRTLSDLPALPSPPVVGNALQFRRDRLGFLTACAREHGDAVRFRIGPVGVVLLSHPEAVRHVLTVRQRDFRKGPVLQRARAVLGDGLLTSEGDTHRQDRRLLQAAFHPSRITRYAEQMIEVATKSVHGWTPGQPRDIHADTVRTTLTVAGRTLFGTQLDEDVELVSDALNDLLSAYGMLMLPLGQQLVRLPPTRQRLRRGTAALDGLTDRLIAERQASVGPDGEDLLSVLLAEGDPHKARDQLVTLLLAGHETTANALAFACHLLALDQDVQQDVAAEVLGVCGHDGVPQVEDVTRLPLTRAVLAETLRLFPPSWTMGRQSRGPTEVDDLRLPADTVVLLSQWVVHRDARWWPDPEQFDPERFLTRDPERPRFAYFPFGGGTRQCIGEGFAWTEGVLMLATILAAWRLHPVRGRELTLDPLLTLRPREGVWLVPEPRG